MQLREVLITVGEGCQALPVPLLAVSPPFSLLTHIINFFPDHIQIASLIALFSVSGKKGVTIGWGEKIWAANICTLLTSQVKMTISTHSN